MKVTDIQRYVAVLAFIVDIFARKLCSIWSLAIWKGKSNTSYTIQTRQIKWWVTLFSENFCLKLSLVGKQRCLEQYLAKKFSGKRRDSCALYRAASQWSGWWFKLMGAHTSSWSQQTTRGVQEVPHVTLQCTSRETQQMYLTNSWQHPHWCIGFHSIQTTGNLKKHSKKLFGYI